jgi:hypothetical protein
MNIVSAAAAASAVYASGSAVSTRMIDGHAVFDNSRYRISCGDDSSVTIGNLSTGECYRAWGDPHMSVDGQHVFDFWGTTTIHLDDGTGVTIQTTPSNGGGGQTLCSIVTIVSGDYGVRIRGVDGNILGDLRIEESRGGGRVLDAIVADGNSIDENELGSGFIVVDREGNVREVNQAYIDQTDLLRGGALNHVFKEAFRCFAGLVYFHMIGDIVTMLAAVGCTEADNDAPRPTQRTRAQPHPKVAASGDFSTTAPAGTPQWSATAGSVVPLNVVVVRVPGLAQY